MCCCSLCCTLHAANAENFAPIPSRARLPATQDFAHACFPSLPGPTESGVPPGSPNELIGRCCLTNEPRVTGGWGRGGRASPSR